MDGFYLVPPAGRVPHCSLCLHRLLLHFLVFSGGCHSGCQTVCQTSLKLEDGRGGWIQWWEYGSWKKRAVCVEPVLQNDDRTLYFWRISGSSGGSGEAAVRRRSGLSVPLAAASQLASELALSGLLLLTSSVCFETLASSPRVWLQARRSRRVRFSWRGHHGLQGQSTDEA